MEFEPTIPAGERSQTHALDRAATEIGTFLITLVKYVKLKLIIFVCILVTNPQDCSGYAVSCTVKCYDGDSKFHPTTCHEGPNG